MVEKDALIERDYPVQADTAANQIWLALTAAAGGTASRKLQLLEVAVEGCWSTQVVHLGHSPEHDQLGA